MRCGAAPTIDSPPECTLVTELATTLGVVGDNDLAAATQGRQAALSNPIMTN